MNKNLKRAGDKKIDGNLNGEGLIMGGLYVINKKGEQVRYTYLKSDDLGNIRCSACVHCH